MLRLIKFSLHECDACQRMAEFDSSVAAELGLDFVDVDMRDPGPHRADRLALLHRHPLRNELSLPAYLLIEDIDGEAVVHGETNGAMSKESFRVHLEHQIKQAKPAELQSLKQG